MRTAPLIVACLAFGFAQPASRVPGSANRAAAPSPAPRDPRLVEPLSHVSSAAELFTTSAQQYICRETLRQRVIHPGVIRKLKKHGEPVVEGALRYDTRQIDSFYAFTTIGASPAIHEVRQIITVDKERLLKEDAARKLLRDTLLAHDDQDKGKLLGQFTDEAMNGVATDLGQLILLFEPRNIGKFAFELDREEPVGNLQCLVIRYTQTAGKESVHINENGKDIKESMQGWLWVTAPAGVPVRITVIASHKSGKQDTRDESEVDYATIPSGALLPTSVLHRRYEDDILAAEDDFRYTGWQSLK